MVSYETHLDRKMKDTGFLGEGQIFGVINVEIHADFQGWY